VNVEPLQVVLGSAGGVQEFRPVRWSQLDVEGLVMDRSLHHLGPFLPRLVNSRRLPGGITGGWRRRSLPLQFLRQFVDALFQPPQFLFVQVGLSLLEARGKNIVHRLLPLNH
jgi:hypothetical protein